MSTNTYHGEFILVRIDFARPESPVTYKYLDDWDNIEHEWRGTCFQAADIPHGQETALVEEWLELQAGA